MSTLAGITEYAEGTLWYSLEDDTITVGFTEKGLEQAGAIQGVEFPEQKDEFLVDDWVGEVQGKDSIVPLLAPRAIRVEEINEAVRDEVSLIEDDPTGDAWIFRATILQE